MNAKFGMSLVVVLAQFFSTQLLAQTKVSGVVKSASDEPLSQIIQTFG